MTVQKLIEYLSKCDPAAEVVIEAANRTDSYADGVESIRSPKNGSKEVWLCGSDGFGPEFRDSFGFTLLFEDEE